MGRNARKPPNYIMPVLARTFALFVLSCLYVPAVSTADALFPRSTRDEIIRVDTEGEASRFVRKADQIGLAPNTLILGEVTNIFREIDADIGVEVVFVTDLDARFEALGSSNILLEVSKLAGLQYYSASRSEMRLLFEESHFVESPDNRSRTSDPTVESLPAALSLYVLQRDLTFGENVYRFDFAATQSMIHIWFENITPYRYGPIRFIRSGDMRLHIYLFAEADRLIYYGFFGANAIRFPLVERTIYASFYNRIFALYSWFAERI